jgi:hypothetical protein
MHDEYVDNRHICTGRESQTYLSVVIWAGAFGSFCPGTRSVIIIWIIRAVAVIRAVRRHPLVAVMPVIVTGGEKQLFADHAADSDIDKDSVGVESDP